MSYPFYSRAGKIHTRQNILHNPETWKSIEVIKSKCSSDANNSSPEYHLRVIFQMWSWIYTETSPLPHPFTHMGVVTQAKPTAVSCGPGFSAVCYRNVVTVKLKLTAAGGWRWKMPNLGLPSLLLSSTQLKYQPFYHSDWQTRQDTFSRGMDRPGILLLLGLGTCCQLIGDAHSSPCPSGKLLPSIR